jgi:hypothetical protein
LSFESSQFCIQLLDLDLYRSYTGVGLAVSFTGAGTADEDVLTEDMASVRLGLGLALLDPNI